MALPKQKLYERDMSGHYIVYLHVKRQGVPSDEPQYIGYFMAAFRIINAARIACDQMDSFGKHGINAYFTVVDSISGETVYEPA